jgi:sec-independent protein translocase protein TatA
MELEAARGLSGGSIEPMMAWLSPAEMGVIAVVILLLFGAKKIPELMRSMGSGLSQFKKGLREGVEEVKRDEAAP